MVFLSAKEIGARWGISQRRVAILCKDGRINGAQMVAGTWIIPEGAEKPNDARIKSGKYLKSELKENQFDE